MPRPISLSIHSSALTHNYTVARKYAGEAKAWAIVKANAYGHGLELAKNAFHHADGLALIEVDNAIKLRQMGWSKPVLLLEGFFDATDLPSMQQHQIDIVVHCFEQIEMLEQAHLAGAEILRVHLKINSGMNRLGFQPQDVLMAYQRLSKIQKVQVIELIMHFANADDEFNPHLPMAEQISRFEQAKASLGDVNLGTSLSNSVATILNPRIKNNWIRAGIILYGSSPNCGSPEKFDLLPTMTLKSKLIAIQSIQAGEAVGYGSRFVASKPMRIGVVACGYADGYPRHAVDGTPVVVEGVRTGIVGRVSMDLITVDVTDIADAKVGSTVTLWGKGMPIDEVAQAAGTISYELMCAVTKRVPIILED